MRVKELVHWLDSFDLSPTPWTAEPADWATGLNLLARLLHPTLERRIEEQQRKEGEEATEEEEEEEGEEEGDDEGEEGRKKNKTVGKEDHQRLIKRPSQCHPSTQLALQEVLEMAERVLGVPQFAVIADLKHSTAENQLALFVSLCALHFALGPADIKPYRDFQFAFRIYFDMDSDGSTRECTACGQFVHLIERSVLAGQVWHRSCLKCALCGRQLYRGAFHFLSTSSAAFVRSVDDQPIRLECFEHRANAILFGDPKYRLALPPPSLPPPLPPPPPHSSMSISQHSFQQQQQIPPPQLDKRASLASMVASSCSLPISSPPPRPPPPKKIVPAQAASPKSGAAEQQQIGKEEKQNGQRASDERARKEENAEEEEEEEESIEKKIASAAAARHDAPVPMPRMSLMMKQTRAESGNKPAAEKTSWEVLEYPEELNPFGSEDEEEAEGHNGKRGMGRNPSDLDGANPFETDTEEEEGDDEDEKRRIRRSPGHDDGSSDIGSGCSSPLAGPKPTPMVQLVQPKQPENAEENARGEERQQHQQKELLQTVTVDQPTVGHNMNMANPLVPMYVPPLGPLVFRVGQLAAAADKSLGLLPLPPPSGSSSSTLSSSIEAQQILHELDTKLRRLHSQLDQWEITGTRLEGQIIRELAQKENQVWRKNGNKLVNEYAQLVEKRCIALAKEGMLTRRYMDIFLNFAHAELDKQMREEAAGTPPNAGGKMAQFNELLAQFLHIRNELTELERREKEAKTKMAEMAKAGEAKKEAKRKEKEEKQQVKKDKKTKKNEDEKEEGRRIASEAKTIGEEKRKEKAGGEATGGGGGGRLLKNTFKNLKKKL